MTDAELHAAALHVDGTPCPNGAGGCDARGCGHLRDVPCDHCGEPVTVGNATLEAIGPYHHGCFGWPCCMCPVAHKGDCPP